MGVNPKLLVFYKKRRFRTHTQREGDRRRQGEDSHPYTKERRLAQEPTPDFRPLASRIVGQYILVVRPPSLWYLVSNCRKLMKEVKPKIYIGIGL